MKFVASSVKFDKTINQDWYTYSKFDENWDIQKSIFTNKLPLSSFKVSNGVPCLDEINSISSFTKG